MGRPWLLPVVVPEAGAPVGVVSVAPGAGNEFVPFPPIIRLIHAAILMASGFVIMLRK
jgi:hypothetical protein